MQHNDNNSQLVYSSEKGRICPTCSQPVAKCHCKQQPIATKGDGIVRIQRETKGRKGSGVSLISGVPLVGDELKKLAKSLKQKCGTGGTIKNGVIEIQGDHRELLLLELQKLGWKVKIAGG
jgi:translation initiation factor 1